MLFTIILFAPESPWWLVRQGRFADAEDSCRRLSSREYYTPESGKRQVAYMIHTTAMEREESEGARFVDCFRGKINLRRTEIVRTALVQCFFSRIPFPYWLAWSALELLPQIYRLGAGAQKWRGVSC